MRFEVFSKTFHRLYLALLSSSAFALSMTSECNDFGLRSVNDDQGGWVFYNFTDSAKCLMCFRRVSKGPPRVELVLPCLEPSIEGVKISYLFRHGNSGNGGWKRKPLRVVQEGTKQCQDDYDSATKINNKNVIVMPTAILDFKDDMTRMRDIDHAISYRIKIAHPMEMFPKNSTVCVTNVKFIAFSEQQTGTNFPTWVIFVIILIAMLGFCTVLTICFYQRKLLEYLRENHVNAGRADAQIQKTKGNEKSETDVITNATCGHDLVNDKNDEYHFYTEIDIKDPTNSEMIYNAAYNSFSSN